MQFKHYYKKRYQGMTMIELAVVLGVAGLLVGGVWVAASAANEAHRVNQTVEQIRQIVDNVRTRYTSVAVIPQLPYTDLTQQVAAADGFPAETRLTLGVDPATCSLGTPCYFANPWSSDGTGSVCTDGTYCLGSFGNLLVQMTGNTNSAFVLLLRNLPQQACIKIAARFIDIWDEVGITAIGFNNGDSAIPATRLQAPPTIGVITADCAAGNANSLYFAFRHAP